MKNEIISYIRDDQRTPYGVVVAIKDGGEIRYGFSMCNPKDKWDKHRGIKIARSRALSHDFLLPISKKKQFAITSSLYKLKERAIKYFKNGRENITNS